LFQGLEISEHLHTSNTADIELSILDLSSPNALLAWFNLRNLIMNQGQDNEQKMDISFIFPAFYFFLELILLTFFFYPSLAKKFILNETLAMSIADVITSNELMVNCIMDIIFLTICLLSRLYYLSL
jgi:hypothetical protein